MELNPSAKKKLAVLGVALAALAIDRGLIFSGGSDASASETPGATTASPTTPNAKAAQAAPRVDVAPTLERVREEVVTPELERDAFRLPELLRSPDEPEQDLTPEVTEQPDTPASEPTRVDVPEFEVTSIIASSTGSPMAVINGVPIRVGQTRDGITLVSVSSRIATIRYADQTINVRLSE